MYPIFEKICLICTQFVVRDSAEASAEASVDLAEASVLAESRFTPIRSFTSYFYQTFHKILWDN